MAGLVSDSNTAEKSECCPHRPGLSNFKCIGGTEAPPVKF